MKKMIKEMHIYTANFAMSSMLFMTNMLKGTDYS